MTTVSKPIKFSGIGIHSGTLVHITVQPTDRDGIFFKRVDNPSACLIPALWDNVSTTGLMSTSIGVAPNNVQTIEHFMAALFVMGIDSAIIEIDGAEFPIMDGGMKNFIEIFQSKVQSPKSKVGARGNAPKQTMKKIIVKREIIATRRELIKQMPVFKRIALWLHGLKTGRREDGFVRLSPDDRGLVLDVTLDYPDVIIGRQRTDFIFDSTVASRARFIERYADSRTFGRIWEWEYLKSRGMGRGADEHNVIAINDRGDGTLNELHSPDEFVRHKLVDAVGDMFTSGGFIIGKLESVKGSHALNNLVLRKLFQDPGNYDTIGQ